MTTTLVSDVLARTLVNSGSVYENSRHTVTVLLRNAVRSLRVLTRNDIETAPITLDPPVSPLLLEVWQRPWLTILPSHVTLGGHKV